MGNPRLTARERIILRSRRDPRTECWIWTGCIDQYGYGKMSVQYRGRGAHRVTYELWFGPVSDGKQLDHVCRNRACVNPWHLEEVTVGENIRRGHKARGVAGGRNDHSAAQKRYDRRKRLGLPGPQPGESRAEYHARIDNQYHSVHADLWDTFREGK